MLGEVLQNVNIGIFMGSSDKLAWCMQLLAYLIFAEWLILHRFLTWVRMFAKKLYQFILLIVFYKIFWYKYTSCFYRITCLQIKSICWQVLLKYWALTHCAVLCYLTLNNYHSHSKVYWFSLGLCVNHQTKKVKHHENKIRFITTGCCQFNDGYKHRPCCRSQCFRF